MSKVITIYALLDSDGSIFYVGATKNIDLRFRTHQTASGTKRIGVKPSSYKVLQTTTVHEAGKIERGWYEAIKALGYNLAQNDRKFYPKPAGLKGYTLTQIGALCDEFDVHYLTMRRWIERGSKRLTTERAKSVLMNLPNPAP